MSRGAETTLWARAACDELARAGLREVVVAPGSRSTPLVMALAADERVRCRVHLDERSAAFFALGVGEATGRPAALVTTSGTATANAFPAVVEAAQSETPLLVLTADRPHHLRDSDANQAIDQVGLYGRFVRASFDVAPPRTGGPELRHLRGVAARAVAAAVGPPAGPVHLNFPFDKPLEPSDGLEGFAAEHPLAAGGRADGLPYVRIHGGRMEAGAEALERLLGALSAGRGVLVAGPSPDAARLGPAVHRLAAATGCPVLADPLSGARFGAPDGAHVVAAYDLFLRDESVRERLAPDLIVRVGASPTSAALQGWMLHHSGAPHVVIDAGHRWKDHGGVASEYVRADAAATLETLAELAARTAADAWVEDWQTADRAARSALSARDDSGGGVDTHEGDIARAVVESLPDGAALFVSSSMPVRDVDAFGLPAPRRLAVFGNRGASGIDGVVSTAYGVASALGAPTVCLVGDVAFFHDQNGLLWSRESDAPVVFVLVDNDGGGIFHMLPIAEHEPDFTRYFATPHGLDFRHAADMHGLGFEDVEVGRLGGALRDALARGRSCVLRVPSDRVRNTLRRRAAVDAVARSVREALG